MLVDHLSKKGGINFYDPDNEEVVVYLSDPDAKYKYIARVTSIVLLKLGLSDIDPDETFVLGYLDKKSLMENLKFERDQSAEKEDYQSVISFRDLIKTIQKAKDNSSQDLKVPE